MVVLERALRIGFRILGRASTVMAVFSVLTFAVTGAVSDACAREVKYDGSEVNVYVKAGEPTQVSFPGTILGGFKKENSAIALEREGNFLILFAQQHLDIDGEVIIVHLEDNRSYSLRFIPEDDTNPRDSSIEIQDTRQPVDTGDDEEQPQNNFKQAPTNRVAGFMREMVLTAEFGKRKGIPGYRRSNRFSGETLLHDGAIEAKIDEIFVGSNYWGYVISVENLLDTNQVINPATFQLDGTRAISASAWQLSPRPRTEEQEIANAHRAKIYVITRAKRF